MLPHIEARMAAPMTAVRESLAEGDPLIIWMGLHLLVEQQSIFVIVVTVSKVPLVVVLHPAGSLQPWRLKPLKPVTAGAAGERDTWK